MRTRPHRHEKEDRPLMLCYVTRNEGPFNGHNLHERVTLTVVEAQKYAAFVRVHSGPHLESKLKELGAAEVIREVEEQREAERLAAEAAEKQAEFRKASQDFGTEELEEVPFFVEVTGDE